ELHNLNTQDVAVVEWRDKVETQNDLVDKLDRRKQDADANVAAAEAKLNAIIGHEAELEKSIKRMNGNVSLITKRLGQLSDPLVQGVVNAPVIEFAVPTYKVEQIVAEK